MGHCLMILVVAFLLAAVAAQAHDTCSEAIGSCKQKGDVLLQSRGHVRKGLLQLSKELDGSAASVAEGAGVEREVDLLTGTDSMGWAEKSSGNTLPQVKRPWGMNDWVPHTGGHPAPESDFDFEENPNWFFDRSDTEFKGMKCTHQPSPWMGDYADFLLLPHVGSELLQYNSSKAEFLPHMFAADLRDTRGAALRLELAPTNRGAALRMKFAHKRRGHRFLTVGVRDGWLEATSHGLHGATQSSSGGAKNLTMFFVIRSGTPVEEAPQDTIKFFGGAFWKPRDYTIKRQLKFSGAHHGIVDLSVGTSFISMEQAELNRQREVGDRTVEEVASEGRAVWHAALSTVELESLDAAQRGIFYTNLWKAMLFPRTFYEVDAAGGEVHYSPYTGNVERGRLVADIGMWDAYLTVFPMLSLLFPEEHQAAIAGLVQASEENVWLPQWPSPGARTMMPGTMGDAILADAITKCGKNCSLDRERAYRAIRKDAFEEPAPGEERGGRTSLAAYAEKGYVPAEESEESVSLTLGYMLADAAVANAAESLGKVADAKELRRRSGRYGVLFDEESRFFRPRLRNGSFEEPFDPLAWRNGFTEGSAWHYRFYVPHDVPGLQRLMGGRLCQHVEEMLMATHGESFHVGGYPDVVHEMQEASALQSRFGLYAHSNQPVHDTLWVAKKAGCHALADKYLRKVMDELYRPQGYAGDEDNGEMSAWYVLSALGLYQLEPGNPVYMLGSPMVRGAKIRLGQGKDLVIATQNQSLQNVYVRSASWTDANRRTHEIVDNTIRHEDLLGGGTLTFVMSPIPPDNAL